MAEIDYKIEDALPIVKFHGLNTAKDVNFSGTTTLAGPVATINGTVYPIVAPSVAPTAYTGDATLVAANLNTNVTNTGASGTITLTLPAVSGLTGYTLHVGLTVAQIVRLDPAGTESIFLDGSGVAGKYVNIAGVIGNYADVYCNGTSWVVVGRAGVVTKEA